MPKASPAREKLLDAALSLLREQGFAATTVDDLCARAGVTKGAFFHHFATKEELGVVAAQHWSAVTSALFAQAPYHAPARPLERVLAYVAFRRSLLVGDIANLSCVAGTMVQEAYALHPAIRDACAACIYDHAETLVGDIEAAMAEHGVCGPWTARSLAAHMQAVIQGSFILAKAKNDVAAALESVDHLERYVTLLFAAHKKRTKGKKS